MAWLFVALALGASLAWASGILWFLSRFRPPARHAEGRVTLVLAVTGRTAGLPPLFAALAGQTLTPRRLIVAVESKADPAFAQVHELAPTLPFLVQTVIAGVAEHRSQKGTNLIRACAEIDALDEAVVLFDADILPQRDWLSALATPALNGHADLVTGYRWHALRGAGLVRHLVAWLDHAIALGPSFVATRLVWGGSIAISGAAFRRMDLPSALERSFSTDGAISRRAAELDLRVLTRRAVLLPTPPEGGDREAWAFKKRQLQIVRVYRPALWAWMGVLLHAEACALPLLLLALAGGAQAEVASAGLGLVAALGLARAAAHDHVARRIGVRDGLRERLAQLLLGVLAPITAPAVLALWWASARWRRIRWRHIEYEVLGPDEVRVLRRHPPGATA